MIHSHGHRGIRLAFTLIELLVVMAIIAVLMGLLLSGVMAIRGAQSRAQTQYELTKMTESLQAAMKGYQGQPTWLPSQLVLNNDLRQYNTPSQSASALRQMFGPRFLLTSGSDIVKGSPQPRWPRANWKGWDGSGNMSRSFTLQGHQCLVFYLGGLQTTTGASGCLGFSTDPLLPMSLPNGTTPRYGPYYEFKASRLVQDPTTGFFSYIDPYGTKPYAYFSTFGSANKYNNTSPGDCSSLSVMPYFVNESSPTLFLNPNTFQIISAGKNGLFGAGGAWNPTSGSSDSNTQDDLSNFSKSQLGAPQS